ncbi:MULTISPECIES: hypothetical protein [unclassified Pseudomonas]|uniref:hypothetical protein n=1 Tax=unclassified Pseudomonas TaxID=196821 RepID=UPI002114E3EE|nr:MULTISPECIES: hypothetical protein [unclassified Pseudomonas]
MKVLTDSKYQATLFGNILLTGIEGLGAEDYQFALSCNLLALEQADKIYNSETRPGRWIDYYADVLWSHGWNRDQPGFEYVKPNFSGSVQQAWSNLANGILPAEQVAGVEAGLASLEKQVDLLQKIKGVSDKVFDLKIVPVSYNADGEMEMVITHVRFIKSSLNSQYLFWNISQSMTQLDIRARRVVISPRVIEARRPSVEAALRKQSTKIEQYLI